jgi:hypothetical protein
VRCCADAPATISDHLRRFKLAGALLCACRHNANGWILHDAAELRNESLSPDLQRAIFVVNDEQRTSVNMAQ